MLHPGRTVRRTASFLLLVTLLVGAAAFGAEPPGPKAAAKAPTPAPAPIPDEPVAAPESGPSPGVPPPATAVPAPAKEGAAEPTGEPAPGEGGQAHTIRGKTVWDTFLRGGLLMWPILLCSLLGMAFAVERLIALRQNAVAPKDLAKAVLAAVEKEGPSGGIRVCQERPSALGRVLAAGLALAGGTREEMNTAMQEAGERELWHLERFAKPLNVITGVAPLLGLLGTVQGMIMAFDVVAAKGALGDPRELAEGIATALLTTFAGLTVAIPCLLFYQFFRSKSDRLIIEIEETAAHMINQLQGATPDAHPSPLDHRGRGDSADAAH
jgi:biopolymer transport protein ExbB